MSSTMQRVAILYDASQAVLSTFDLDEVLNQVLAIVRDYFHLQNGSIMLLDETSQRLCGSRPFWRLCAMPADFWVPFGKGITGAAAKRAPIYSPDVTTDSRYIPIFLARDRNLRYPSWCAMKSSAYSIARATCPAYFDNETVDLLTLFATQASIGLQNAKLYSMLQRRAANWSHQRHRQAHHGRTGSQRTAGSAMHPASPVVPGEHVSIFLRDEEAT